VALARKIDRRLNFMQRLQRVIDRHDAITAAYVGFSIHRQRARPRSRQAMAADPWPIAARKTQTAGQCARPLE
jgi:hypothetical protein